MQWSGSAPGTVPGYHEFIPKNKVDESFSTLLELHGYAKSFDFNNSTVRHYSPEAGRVTLQGI